MPVFQKTVSFWPPGNAIRGQNGPGLAHPSQLFPGGGCRESTPGMGIPEHDFYLPEEHRCFFVIFAKKRSGPERFREGMPPPLWHPHHGILTYYLYEKSHNFRVNLNRCIPMRPIPRRGTGGAGGGLHKKKEVFSKAPDILKKSPGKNRPDAISSIW